MPRWRVYAVCGLLLALFVWAVSCGKASDPGHQVILVSTAVSLKESLEEIAQTYETSHPGVKIRFNYGSSGALQKQIEQGAPADLFLSAGRKQMDALIAKKLVKQSEIVLANRLVMIVSTDSGAITNHADELLDPKIRKVAIGEPDIVPAGLYARQTLTSLGLWNKLQPKLVYAQDVRQVLTYVQTGNAEAGIVYRTDAVRSGKVRIAVDFPESSHEAIQYPFGLLTEANHGETAADFYRYLQSDPALAVFHKYGFLTP